MTAVKEALLIVDDETSNLAVLHHILAPEYTVFTAKSGPLALKRAHTDKPALILLDVIMPGMDGFEVLKRLKDSADTRHIPVITITGLEAENNEEKALLLGAADYLVKPFANAAVRTRIKNQLQIARQMQEIEQMGMMDPLTNMPNKRYFDDRLAMEWRGAIRGQKPLALLMMDVDALKDYNDAYGYLQGDALLRAMAGIFLAAARRPYDFAARLGEEEFCLLLPDTALEDALTIAEKIRTDIATLRIPALRAQRETSATISIGVTSQCPAKTDAVRTFLARTAEKLQHAKKAGKNRVSG